MIVPVSLVSVCLLRKLTGLSNGRTDTEAIECNEAQFVIARVLLCADLISGS